MKRKISLFLAFLLLSIGSALAQKITVKGTVFDENGETVIGATVREKGVATNGTQTNIDGKFTLTVKKDAIIVVSFIGYKTQELKATPQMTIRMVPDSKLLGDVVVIGYGSGRAINTTTASVVKVNAKDLESKPAANVLEGLQGKVSGLSVTSVSGEPGQGANIQLHGEGSLGLGGAPLYILDGMPVGSGTIMGLNPNDFESVQILKDAAATAIYGSRASNGVIFITTKRGHATERATVTVTAQYGVSNLASTKFYDSMMNTEELLNLWDELRLRDKESLDEIRKIYPNDTDWKGYFFRKNAPIYNANVSIAGGSNNTQYYLSAQHFFQQGLMAGRSLYSKNNLRANISTKVNDWLSVYLNNGLYYDNTQSSNHGHQNWSDGGIFYVNPPFLTPYKPDGSPYYDTPIPGTRSYTGWQWSPQYIADQFKSKSTSLEYVGNLGITIRPISGLALRSNIGIDVSDGYSKSLRDPRAEFAYGNGRHSESFGRGVEWTFTNTAEYMWSPAKGHALTFLLGHEYNKYDGEGFSGGGYGLTYYRLMHLDKVTDPKKKSINSWDSSYAYLSFFGRISYDLLDRYFFDVTVRNDASSKFPPAHRNALFWSAGVKWNAKKEAFLENVSWLDRLDAKLSVGTAGNSSLGNYQYFATAGASNPFNGQVSRVIVAAGNPDLTWEKQRKTTIGFDAHFLRRFGINFEVYDRLTTDMVMDVPYTLTSGVPSNWENVGSYVNRGFDLRVDIDLWKGQHGNYASFYGNINYNRDKVLSLFKGLDEWYIPNTYQIYKVGSPVMFCMPIFKQVNPETGDPEWYNRGKTMGETHKDPNDITTGNDFNQDALLQNTGVRRNTPWTGGFGFNANYEGFYLTADFSLFLGKHMINNDLFFTDNPVNFPKWNTSKAMKDRWKKSGDKSIYPDAMKYEITMQFDSRMLLNASYMRLRNLTVGYDIPAKYLKHQDFFKGVKLGITGRNLLTFTGYRGVDPEPNTNLVYGMNPATMQVVGSVEIKF